MDTPDKKLINILEKDFQELTKSEIQVLRNETRKRYGLEGKIDSSTVFNSYLNLKRKYITELEQLLVSTKQSVQDFGPFVGVQSITPKAVLSVFDGLTGDATGFFYIEGTTYLPIMTVSYFDDRTEVICLSPRGGFCKVTNEHFDFEI